MTKVLNLADGFTPPVELMTQKIAILARTGAGKTNTATVIAEEVLDAKQQVVAIDPKVLPRWSAKVRRTATCWWWTGTKRNGYGVMWIDNKTHYAHRVSHALFVGSVTSGLVVCHRCDQPLCVNPAHLFVGTRADNNADMDAKGRRRCVGPRGLAHPKAWLTDADAAGIRLMAACGVKQREIASAYGCSQNSVFQAIHRFGRFA